MIEYQYTEGKWDIPIKVRIDGVIIGEIKPIKKGWQYFPNGQKEGGDIFETLLECQKSLE